MFCSFIYTICLDSEYYKKLGVLSTSHIAIICRSVMHDKLQRYSSHESLSYQRICFISSFGTPYEYSALHAPTHNEWHKKDSNSLSSIWYNSLASFLILVVTKKLVTFFIEFVVWSS